VKTLKAKGVLRQKSPDCQKALKFVISIGITGWRDDALMEGLKILPAFPLGDLALQGRKFSGRTSPPHTNPKTLGLVGGASHYRGH